MGRGILNTGFHVSRKRLSNNCINNLFFCVSEERNTCVLPCGWILFTGQNSEEAGTYDQISRALANWYALTP